MSDNANNEEFQNCIKARLVNVQKGSYKQIVDKWNKSGRGAKIISLNEKEKNVVASSWNKLTQQANETYVDFGLELFHRLLYKYPEFKRHFNLNIYKIKSIKVHSDKVINGLHLIISNIFNDEELNDTLDLLVSIHLNMSIQKHELQKFEEIFQETARNILEGRWSRKKSKAWSRLLDVLWVALAPRKFQMEKHKPFAEIKRIQNVAGEIIWRSMVEAFNRNKKYLTGFKKYYNIDNNHLLTPKDKDVILKTFPKLMAECSRRGFNLSSEILKKIRKDKEFSRYFNNDLLADEKGFINHSKSINVVLSKMVKYINDEEETDKVREVMVNIHKHMDISPHYFRLLDEYVHEVVNDALDDVKLEFKIATSKLILQIWLCISNAERMLI